MLFVWEPVRLRFSVWFGCLFLLVPAIAHPAVIEKSQFCVDDQRFHFEVDLSTPDAGEFVLRIGADGAAFTSPVERIEVNFDSVTGDITRDINPRVSTFDSPPADRWQDGDIADATIIELAPGTWRFSGTVPHGPDRFQPGDFVESLGLRFFIASAESSQPQGVETVDREITSCDSTVGVPGVNFQRNPPLLDGKISLAEWSDAASINLPNTEVRLLHDSRRLYVLINAFGDTVNNPFAEGGADQFWLLFDMNEDGAITPNIDRRYRLQSGTGNLRYETFSSDAFLFNPPVEDTYSARAEGFDCFLADGSRRLLPSPQCNQHRVWEVAIDLREIEAEDTQSIRLGVLVQSEVPAFVDTNPSDLASFQDYLKLELLGNTTINVSSVQDALSPRAPELTQAIQTPASPVSLTAGKDTLARVVIGLEPADSGTALVYLYGQRNGMDLPGSPLTALQRRYSVSGDLRANPGAYMLFSIPSSWTHGTVGMHVKTRQPWIDYVGLSPNVDVERNPGRYFCVYRLAQ